MKGTSCTLMIALLLAGSLMLALDVRPAWAIAETVYIKCDGSVVPSWAPISSLDNVTYTFTGNISYPAYYGIIVERNNIVIDGNGYTVQGDQSGIGLNLTSINNVTIKDVKLESFSYSIRLEYSSKNSIVRNSMTNSVEGIHLQDSSSNLIYHNNFANNTVQVYSHNSTNIWDSGYPLGGNYWSDYTGTDFYAGPYQNITTSDLLGDTPYVIDVDNQDHYPLMIYTWMTLPERFLSRYDCVFRVSGVSMTPTILQDDIIWVHNTTNPSEIFTAPYPQGELVVYRRQKPDNTTIYIIRRAISKWYENETWYFTVRSDGAQGQENITMSVIIGKVVSLLRGINVALRDRTFMARVYANSTLNGLTLNTSDKYLSLNVTGPLVRWQTSYCEVIIPNILLSGIYDVKIGGQSILFTKNDCGFYTLIAFETNQTTYVAGIYGSTVGTPPDIAILNVETSKTVIGKGYSMTINVNVENEGDFTETFNITLFADTTPIRTSTLTLSYKNSSTVAFNWNTEDMPKGNYTISAHIAPLPNETDTADNTSTDGTVVVAMVGDVNADGRVNIIDLATIGVSYGNTVSDLRYNPNADINDDGIIDIVDLATCGRNYGKTY